MEATTSSEAPSSPGDSLLTTSLRPLYPLQMVGVDVYLDVRGVCVCVVRALDIIIGLPCRPHTLGGTEVSTAAVDVRVAMCACGW